MPAGRAATRGTQLVAAGAGSRWRARAATWRQERYRARRHVAGAAGAVGSATPCATTFLRHGHERSTPWSLSSLGKYRARQDLRTMAACWRCAFLAHARRDCSAIDRGVRPGVHCPRVTIPQPVARTRIAVGPYPLVAVRRGGSTRPESPTPSTTQLTDLSRQRHRFYHDLRRRRPFYGRLRNARHRRASAAQRAALSPPSSSIRASSTGHSFGTAAMTPMAYYAQDGQQPEQSFLRSPVEFSRISFWIFAGALSSISADVARAQGRRFRRALRARRSRSAGDGEITQFAGRENGYGNIIVMPPRRRVFDRLCPPDPAFAPASPRRPLAPGDAHRPVSGRPDGPPARTCITNFAST